MATPVDYITSEGRAIADSPRKRDSVETVASSYRQRNRYTELFAVLLILVFLLLLLILLILLLLLLMLLVLLLLLRLLLVLLVLLVLLIHGYPRHKFAAESRHILLRNRCARAICISDGTAHSVPGRYPICAAPYKQPSLRPQSVRRKGWRPCAIGPACTN